MLKIKYADIMDHEYLNTHDHHVAEDVLERKIRDQEILVAKYDSRIVGWLRFGFFWDDIPFMNLLMVDEEFRNQGIGKDLVAYWEERMKRNGHDLVMTSTLSDESAQHFYRKCDYRDAGSLLLEGEALEILFTKKL